MVKHALIGLLLLPMIAAADRFCEDVGQLYGEVAEVLKTTVADGRDKGGERALLVTYRLDESSPDGCVGQAMSLLEIGWEANAKLGGNLDGMVLIAQDEDGSHGVLMVKTEALERFRLDGDLMQYLASWKIKRIDKDYLTKRDLGRYAVSGSISSKK
jgi:hypothetical protein